MNDSARDITRDLLDALFCEGALPEITPIDRLDAALFAMLDPPRVNVSKADVASLYSAAIEQYRSLLLAQLEQSVEFITRQASNVVMATVSGALSYPKPMRTQREVLLAHYNVKFGGAYRFALALTLAAAEFLGGTAKVFSYLQNSSAGLLRPFLYLTPSQMAVVISAFSQPRAAAFRPELLSHAPDERLSWNRPLVKTFLSAYIEALPASQIDQFMCSSARESASRQLGARPLDLTVLSKLFSLGADVYH